MHQMNRNPLTLSLRCLLGLALVCAVALPVRAQSQPRHSEVKVEAIATGEEISGQTGLWVMEVYYKPLRMIAVDITNPKTGKTEPQYVWYLPYRAINRPLASAAVENLPVNDLDAPVLPPKFIPEFTLVTMGESPKVYHDQIIPEALAAIRKRERGMLESSVSAVTDVPPPQPFNAEAPQEISGVAMFTGIDPTADRYTLFMTGFSNGVNKTTAPDGSTVVQHKTIEMKYWRPGDEFDLREPEIRPDGPPRWIYR